MSVTKRKGSPKYQYDFTLSGRRFRGTLETTSRKEAEELYTKIRTDTFANLKLGRKQDILLRYVFDKYYSEHAEAQAWGKSVSSFLARMGEFWGWDTPLADIDDKQVGRLVTKLKTTRVGKNRFMKPSSINRHLEAFRKLYRLSRDIWGYNVTPINFSLHMQTEAHGRTRYLIKEEAEQLVMSAAPHLQPVIRFALYTGLRKGNILNLKWKQVNLKGGTIAVKVKSKQPGGKNHTIYLAKDAIKLLKALPKDSEFVFTYEGQQLKNVKRAFKTACKNAGISDFRFHDLRHTHASWLVQAKTPLSVVQDMLGHADPKTTRRYAHHEKGQYIEALENTFTSQSRRNGRGVK